jgi:Translation initiation factor 1A / IF-1
VCLFLNLDIPSGSLGREKSDGFDTSPLSAEYAQVLRMLGNGRLEAQCIDGIKRLCHIRGKMRKKVWVNMVRVPHRAA